jgi:hypothetical protein
MAAFSIADVEGNLLIVRSILIVDLRRIWANWRLRPKEDHREVLGFGPFIALCSNLGTLSKMQQVAQTVIRVNSPNTRFQPTNVI